MSVFSEQAFLHLQTHRPFKDRTGASPRSGFFPEKDPTKLHNCKQYFWIPPDGSTIVAAYFNPLEKGFRERLILDHYLSHMCKRLHITIGLNVMERDNPWDFRIGFSSGVTMNVEIVLITDRPNFFRVLTAEEMLQRHSYYPTIRLGIFRKIATAFPDRELEDLIDAEIAKGTTNTDEVTNPFYPQKRQIFTSSRPEPPLDLQTVLRDGIGSKMRKKHAGKDETILIIDNRTTTSTLHEFISVVDHLQPMIEFAEFPEIWLYTGYGGVHPKYGQRMVKKHTEFSLIPIKLDPETYEKYRRSKR